MEDDFEPKATGALQGKTAPKSKPKRPKIDRYTEQEVTASKCLWLEIETRDDEDIQIVRMTTPMLFKESDDDGSSVDNSHDHHRTNKYEKSLRFTQWINVGSTVSHLQKAWDEDGRRKLHIRYDVYRKDQAVPREVINKAAKRAMSKKDIYDFLGYKYSWLRDVMNGYKAWKDADFPKPVKQAIYSSLKGDDRKYLLYGATSWKDEVAVQVRNRRT